MERSTASTRPAAVAGLFYPAQPDALRGEVRALLARVDRRSHRSPKALVAPHAGYVYSGPTAAHAYATLAPLRERIRRVVLLGPVHRVPVRGLAVPGAARFATPLGDIEIDAEAIASLRDLPQVVESPAAHAMEHSLEVHLPFLQIALERFRLVPLAVGDASPAEVGQVIERLWGGDETLIVVSSDLSHYLPYAAAREVDAGTLDAMLALDARIDHRRACGATPVNGLLWVAQRHGLVPELLDARNSGDTAGDPSRVVGYASLAFYEPRGAARPAGAAEARERTNDQRVGAVLVGLARGTIARELGLAAPAAPDAPFLREHGATFVTLQSGGQLRGCIGSLQAVRPLGADIEHTARAAAFGDPRFAPLGRDEFDAIRVEVSLLSPLARIPVRGEDELLAQLRPRVDGLVLAYGDRRGTFLPQVWESLPDPRQFLGQLKRKAGLPPDFWSSDLAVFRYTVRKWAEAEASA